MALSDRIPYQALIDRPKLKLPEGKKLAVWVILNVEEWRIENVMPRVNAGILKQSNAAE